MEIKVTCENLKAKITFNANAKEYEKAVDEAYERKKDDYNIEGFRKGKAPRRMIEKVYGDGVFFQDAFANLADEAYKLGLQKNPELRPYGEPSLGLETFVDNKVCGVIEFTVLPKPELGAYKGLEVTAVLNKFDSKMVEEQLEHAKHHFSTLENMGEKPAEYGDKVVIDFVGSMDGQEFEGGKAKDYELELGSHTFIDTFEDQLVGHKAGEKVDVNVVFPDDYGAKTLAGKRAVFNCEIKSVNRVQIPEINDEFAKKVGEFKNVEEWKQQIEEQVKHELNEKNARIKEDAIINKIVDSSKVEMPKEFVEEELDYVMKNIESRMMRDGITLEDYAKYNNTTVQVLRDNQKDEAERICKTKLVLEAILSAEKITVSEQDLEEKLKSFAEISGKSIEEIKKILDQRRIDYMYNDILMQKLMDFLLKHNTVLEDDSEPKTAKSAKKPTTKTSTVKTNTEKKTTSKQSDKTKSTAKSNAKSTAKSVSTKKTTAKSTKTTKK